jgi:integrase
MEYYNAKGYKVYIVIPTKTISWKGAVHKTDEVDTNANVIATKGEIEKMLNYFKIRNFKHYLIFRIFTETGMRLGELVNAKYNEFNHKFRHFNLKEGKTDEKLYNVSKDLARIIRRYITTRKKMDINKEYLFLSNRLKKYSNRSFNLILSRARKKLGIKKNITTKTFRKTLNTLRKKELGCAKEDRERLMGHKTNDVNINNYTIYDYKDNMELFDRYNPYINCNF